MKSFIVPAIVLSLSIFSYPAAAQTVSEEMRQGLARMQSGDLEGALALFDQVIGANPEHGPARMMRAQINIELGDLQISSDAEFAEQRKKAADSLLRLKQQRH